VLGDNKNGWIFAFYSLLVYKGIFHEVYINFLIVGLTHEDIDALFGWWSGSLKTASFETIPRLMKSFMDCKSLLVISHFIKDVPDFKKNYTSVLRRKWGFFRRSFCSTTIQILQAFEWMALDGIQTFVYKQGMVAKVR